jgi:hypothetical protein
VADVENFLVGPVFGHDKTTPVGIIQFINKTAGPDDKEVPDIGEKDILKFKELS